MYLLDNIDFFLLKYKIKDNSFQKAINYYLKISILINLLLQNLKTII